MSQNRSVTRQIRQILGISEDCLFILGFLVGCFTTYGLVHLHGQETCSAQSQRVPSARSQTDSMLDFLTFNQNSPCLTEMLRKVIVPPSNLPYNLENGNREHSHGQAQLIKKLFKGKVSKIFFTWVTVSPMLIISAQRLLYWGWSIGWRKRIKFTQPRKGPWLVWSLGWRWSF